MSDDIKFAILIDAENISPRYIQIVFDEVSNYGISTYRRIYADWTSTRNTRWKEVLLDNSITPIQQYSYTEGKNASDSAMIIDAMDILYTESVDGYVLVSSDSDFTRLASRLREGGMVVIGMGESKTPSAFISACNTFKYLDILYESSEKEKEEAEKEERKAGASKDKDREAASDRSRSGQENGRKGPRASESNRPSHKGASSASSPGSGTSGSNGASGANGTNGANGSGSSSRKRSAKGDSPKPQTTIAAIRRALRSIVRENSDEENWISLANLGNQLNKRFPDFDVRNYGHRKLVNFVESFHEFEVQAREVSVSGKQIFVRLIEDEKK